MEQREFDFTMGIFEAVKWERKIDSFVAGTDILETAGSASDLSEMNV